MTLSEPSDQPSFERATRIGSNQIRLARTTTSSTVDLDEISGEKRAPDSSAIDSTLTEGQEPVTHATQSSTGSTGTSASSNLTSVMRSEQGALWSIEEDETLLSFASKRSLECASKGGPSYWSTVEADMKLYWNLEKEGISRTLSAIKSRMTRLRAIQEVGLTPRTYHPRPWTAEEDAKALALNSNTSSIINYSAALTLFNKRPTFEIKERRYKLLADQKRIAAADERRRQWESQQVQVPTLVGTSSSAPSSLLSQSTIHPFPQPQAPALNPVFLPVQERLASPSVAKRVPRLSSSVTSNNSSKPPRISSRPSLSRCIPSPSSYPLTQSFISTSSRSDISPLNSSVVPSNGSHSRPSNQGPLPTLRPSYLSDHQYTTLLPAFSPSNPRKRYSGETFDASPASKRRLPPYFARETPSVEQRVDLLVSIESVAEGIRLFRRMRERQDEFDLEWEKLIEEKNE